MGFIWDLLKAFLFSIFKVILMGRLDILGDESSVIN